MRFWACVLCWFQKSFYGEWIRIRESDRFRRDSMVANVSISSQPHIKLLLLMVSTRFSTLNAAVGKKENHLSVSSTRNGWRGLGAPPPPSPEIVKETDLLWVNLRLGSSWVAVRFLPFIDRRWGLTWSTVLDKVDHITSDKTAAQDVRDIAAWQLFCFDCQRTRILRCANVYNGVEMFELLN